MWFPPLVLIRGLLWLIYGAAFGARIDFTNLSTYGNGAVMRCMFYMIGETIIMIPLTWYLESVLSVGGSAKPYLFPCMELKQWFDKRNAPKDLTETIENGAKTKTELAVGATNGPQDEPEDVRKERIRAEAGGNNQAVRVLGFQKIFYGRGGVPDKV